MRYLGLDLGTKTLGVSISDKTNFISSIYKTIRHNEEYDFLINEINDIIGQEQISHIVLGYPKNMNNTESKMSLVVTDFKHKLEENIGLPVILVDERLTSVIANNVLIAGNIRRQKRKEKVDNIAAVLILQTYLDRINKERRN